MFVYRENRGMRYLFLAFLACGMSGCAYTHLSDQKDIWVSKGSGTVQQVYYCRANPGADGSATPICFRAAEFPVKPSLTP